MWTDSAPLFPACTRTAGRAILRASHIPAGLEQESPEDDASTRAELAVQELRGKARS